MSDKAWTELNEAIVAEGYEWAGNVMLPSDSDEDGVTCPYCDKGGYWVVLYHRIEDNDKYAYANRCYKCGHIWRDTD